MSNKKHEQINSTKHNVEKDSFASSKVNEREQMNVVIVGHVDHGKSTLVGRLLADTGSLPEGKLEAVKANCERNAKPFEYAFLLDALKDEQSQGITIDTARSFFKSKKRDYIIIDAPGHIEFLKNMVSGAARAQAAMLLIDAKEGIRENSKRHGYMMSFLGIKNIYVCVNKMDLVDYDEWTFNQIKKNYTEFLKEINLNPLGFIPISAREGDNIVKNSSNMPWYKDLSILDAFDSFKKALPNYERDFRLPVQDIYKFTAAKDDRRIVAGRVESGTIKPGDDVVFLPSGKTSKVTTIESFNTDELKEAFAGQSTGVTLDTQVYIRPGELMVKAGQKHPHVSTKFKGNIFWMGRQPLVKNKNYKLKLASQQVPVVLSEILSVLDASELSTVTSNNSVNRHDVAECVFETLKPVAFDEVTRISETGRFVIVDNYEIAGGGIIIAPVFENETSLSKHIKERDYQWERSHITPANRTQKYQHKPLFVVITGDDSTQNKSLAKTLEEKLFASGKNVYYLGISSDVISSQSNANNRTVNQIQQIRQLGEIAHILTDAGLILLTNIADIDEYELKTLKSLNRPNKTIAITVGKGRGERDQIDLAVKDASENSLSEILKLIDQSIVPDPEFTI